MGSYRKMLATLPILVLAASSLIVQVISDNDSIVIPVDLQHEHQLPLLDSSCPATHGFMCRDKLRCISKTRICDNSDDCLDNSDEENCVTPCRNGTFQCLHSKKCIPVGWKCDGVIDCGLVQSSQISDMSDEEDPKCAPEHSCQKNQFRCSDGVTCIQIMDLCGTTEHKCPNKEDQHKFCDNQTEICQEARCKYGCRASPLGEGLCFCPVGQEHDGRECVESNECMLEGACDHICVLDGSKKSCKCEEGYTAKGTQCIAIDIPTGDLGKPMILFQDYSKIKWVSMTGKEIDFYSPFSSQAGSGILGIDFDHMNKTVCWIQHTNVTHDLKCGLSKQLSKTWVKPQPYLFSLEDVSVFAFDWIGANFYFADQEQELVFVCKEELEMCKILIDTDVSKPRGLAVDPLAGLLFMTIWGINGGRLEKAQLDGQGREVLISTKIVYPQGITADLPKKQIYWVDKFMDSIERVNYDGRNRRTIHRGVQHLQDISVFQNDLYFSSLQDNSINKLEKFSNFHPNVSVLVKNLTKPSLVKIYHRSQQPRVKHPCNTFRGQNPCQDFCFPNGKPFAQCGCREGFALQGNGSCIQEDTSNFLAYIRSPSGPIRTIALKNGQIKNSSNGALIPIVKKGSYSAIAYDNLNGGLYYADTSNFQIRYKMGNSTESKIFVEEGVGHVGSIALDWMGRNLYWIDESISAIYVSPIGNPKTKKELIRGNFARPRSLTLCPSNGYMYWASGEENSANSDGKIMRAWMDGTHVQVLISGLGVPLGLSIDDQHNFLYWADTARSLVQRVLLSQDRPTPETVVTLNATAFSGVSHFTAYNGSFYLAQHGKLLKLTVPSADAVSFKEVLDENISEFFIFDSDVLHGKNKCSTNSCQDLCLASPGKPGFSCACRDSKTLGPDGKSCVMDKNYKPFQCKLDEFKCAKFPKCVKDILVCNDINDCGDWGSDEDVSYCDRSYIKMGLCTQNSFHCGISGGCIPHSYICDGIAQCPDGSDERQCSTGNFKCTEFEFQCKESKRCIPKSWVCDNSNDCSTSDTSDTSDEHDQCVYPECNVMQFKCGNSTTCIPLENVCDGGQNCPNGEDEANCEANCRSTKDSFICELEDRCIFQSQLCNGICDCIDGIDELNCPNLPFSCASATVVSSTHDFVCDFDLAIFRSKEECHNVSCGGHSFKCHDGKKCVPLSARCDSYKDCEDNSDEVNCPKEVVKCDFPSRLCDNGTKCVTVEKLCSGRPECGDLSDESNLCSSSENSCGRGNPCSDKCARVPEGKVLCYCPEGKHVDPRNPTQCIEGNPCDNFGTCSQLCQAYGPNNTKHRCLCTSGYQLRNDGFTCSSIDPESPYLVFSNRHELRGLYLNNTHMFQSLISNLRNSIALDFFYNAGKYEIFWSDVVDDKIYRGSLVSGSLINIQIVVERGLATAEGLAVDWIGENLYWVESNLDQIEVSRLNGTYRQTLISGDMVAPRSLALDPNCGLLFWTDWRTEEPRIERATMSGKSRVKIFNFEGSSGEGAWPNGLTLDYVLRRVFWVDARLDSIHTVTYEGSGFHTVLNDHESLSHPFAITLFDGDVFWSDWRSNSVVRANKFRGTNVTTLHKTYTQPFDLKVLHPSRQPRPDVENPCGKNNGNCSHLCLISVNRTNDCGCPHFLVLGSDNKTCIASEKMILFSRLNEITARYYDKPYYHAAPAISSPLIVTPANLQFVAKNKSIYWSDSQSGETKRASLVNPSVETIMDAASGKPLALAVDWISNLIFVVLQNPNQNSLAVTNTDGEYFTTILQGKQDFKNTNSLVVNPYKALLFWEENNAAGDYKILQAQSDGSKRKIFLNSTHGLDNPTSLAYDFSSERLYWINVNSGVIQYYDFGLKVVKSLNFGEVKPHALAVLAVHGSFLFLASEKDDSILRVDKTSGTSQKFIQNYQESIYSIRVYDPEEQIGTNFCAESRGGCQQLCLPLLGKRVCKCALGYTPDKKDPAKCKAIEPVIIYTDSHGIKGISTLPNDTTDLLIPIPLVSFATDIDIDAGSDHLYWLDSEKGRISRIKRDGTERSTVLKDLTAVSGLCIDWISKVLYWANPKDSYIEIAHLNGSGHHVLITEGLDKPLSIAIDPVMGVLFWTDVAKNYIEKSTLDGLNRKIIVKGEKVSDITLDLQNRRLYWCSSTSDRIESVKYDGSERKLVYSGVADVSHIHSPIIDDGILYWVDVGDTDGSIMSLSVKNSSAVQIIRKDLGVTVKDLTLFSKKRQVGTNPCGVKNGGCQDYCFFNGTNANCMCSHGRLGSDGRSCEPFDAFLAFSKVNAIATAHFEINPNEPYEAIQNAQYIRNAIGLAFDYNNGVFFWSDVQLGQISKSFFNGSDFSIVADKQGSVEGLYFEAAHSDLYWTCSSSAEINRINPHLPGAKVEKLIKLGINDKPRGIAVDPCDSKVYWTNWGTQPSIQRAFLSGYEIESIIVTDIRTPNALAIEHAARKLYWVDARLDKIERTNLDGTNRVVVARHNPKHAFSIAIYGEWIYFTDWVRSAVIRANKYTGEDVEIVRNDISKPMSIVAVSPQNLSCDINPCEIMNGGCPEICVLNENREASCECHEGRTLLPDGKCESRSTLLETPPVALTACQKRPCSQICESLPQDSFKCSCLPGYRSVNGVCKANSGSSSLIMFTNQYYIRMVNNLVNNGSLIMQNLTNAVALDYHWELGCVYWSDVTSIGSSIRRACVSTNRSEDVGLGQADMREKILHHSISSPDGIAVDWAAQNLYWCDKGSNTIEVSKLDGRYRKILIKKLQDPRAIVLDPFNGFLYWSDWGEEPIIGKAGMDGSRVQTLISDNLGWPNALTISYETSEIWWADAKEDFIAVSDLNGKNIKIVHSRANNPNAQIHHIFSLSTFEDWIYWSDWETKTIERAHKYTGLNQSSVTTRLIHRPMDVKVFHPYRQRPLSVNPCENNGGCENLCLLTPEGGHICACPENFILNADQRSCTANCTSSQFVCRNTAKCIPKWWMCDSQDDCGDSEDEPESCLPFHCSPGQVQFGNSTCLYPTSLCDGKEDSENGEDEKDCNNFTCLSSHYKCRANATIQSRCIPNHLRCNSVEDCPLKDDEENCAPVSCPPTQFQCATNNKCLQMEWVCDLEDDCGDGSDEEGCDKRTCGPDKFRCNSGKCIPRTWICDGERDCGTIAEDESLAECDQPVTCEKNPSYYLCKNSHKCIPSRWKCDYEPDCPGGDDELIDCSPRNCSESEFRCASDGRCIHQRLVCDGVALDCSDGSDEVDCHVSCNLMSEFQCVNPPSCLPKKFQCDSEIDCLDGSDESNCGNSTYCDGFTCDNECIPYAWLCDGTKDCSGGEDEQMCDQVLPPSHCSTGQYHCSDGTCLNASEACNGIPQCSDDELGCAQCNFGLCSQVCVTKKQNRGKASAYSCECAEGFHFEENRTRCYAKGPPSTLLVASEDHLLRLSKPHDVDSVDLLMSQNPTKIDFLDFLMEDQNNIKLFWSSRTNKAIHVMNISTETNAVGSRPRRSLAAAELITGLEEPRGVAVDWITKVLFYIDAGHKTISASSLDGKRKIVIVKQLSDPFDLAVEPNSGRIYWTDLTNQRIEYANSDGSGRKIILYRPRPAGIAIDFPGERIYFTDISMHTIETVNLEGKDWHIVKRFSSDLLKPYKLDIFEDTVYFTNYSSNKIMRLDKFGKGNMSDITYGLVKASDVLLIHKQKQPLSKNFCSTLHCPNGLCLRNGTNSAVCVEACNLKCAAQGKCMSDSNGRMFCKCQKGFSGSLCEKGSFDYPTGPYPPPDYSSQNTTFVDLCTNRDCRNGGECEVIDQIAYCRCNENWVGVSCELDAEFKKPCLGYCLHGGLCVMTTLEEISRECKCLNGWAGNRCEINTACKTLICFNGGTCVINPENLQPTCKCPLNYTGYRCDRRELHGEGWNGEDDGITWILVLVFILVALSVASLSGCVAYLIMRRKGRPFMHRRMQDSGTVEISNPMFLKDEDDREPEPSLCFDSDKVLLQGTNFSNPIYETMYKEGETSGSVDEKKGLLQDHPLADPLA